MEILFKTSKLRKTLSSESLLVREFGKENARVIMHRMVLLDAADCLADIPVKRPTRRHALSGKRKGQYAIDAKYPFRIVLEPADEPVPIRDDGSVDPERVASIRILRVEDYH